MVVTRLAIGVTADERLVLGWSVASKSIFIFMPLALALVAGALLSAGCGVETDAGDTVTESFAVDEFDELEIDGAFDVTMVLGEEPSVQIETGENLVDDLRVELDGPRLSIGLDDGWFSFTTTDIEARITTTDLLRLDLDGAVSVDIENLDADRFELDLDGASRVAGEGSIGELVIDSNGASRVDFDEVIIDEVEVDADGASRLSLVQAASVSGTLNGATSVDVSDEAEVNVRTEGASSIE